ncbi:DUF4350 domain-containing protein [Neptuniibacter halophilus]|uniref:DUF4350 domain-containing protein n=1 Tax=Neptuniibacter halophilus TaxID=651666 RepID=UPI0025723BCF|nr:DUF4350 domain-containing protein [Neptuniibacter halophilus]
MNKGFKLAIAALICLLGALLISKLEKVERIVNEGPGLSVLRNNFYAAGQFLEQQGMVVQHRSAPMTSKQLGARDTLLLTNTREILDHQSAAELLNWVRRGGNLIWEYSESDDDHPLARLLAVNLTYTDEQFSRLIKIERPAEPVEALSPREKVRHDIRRLEQRINPAALGRFSYRDSSQALEFYIATTATLFQPQLDAAPGELDFRLDAVGRSEYVTQLLSFTLGRGRVSVVTDSSLWSNSRIGQFDHAHLLWQLTQDHEKVYIQRFVHWPSLSQLALSYAPEALLIFGLLMLAGILNRAVRFGPLRQPEGNRRRAISEHIRATARFHHRFRQHDYLLAPLRRAIVRQMQRNHSDFNQLSESEQIALIARCSKIDPDQVRTALNTAGDYNDPQLLTLIKLLVTIRNAL